ncbi:unnamed protein product [Gongylonema pulchrum]|uniref:Uncharacterized protein n=1 Tax=Gongylonema pulchrum TaxID=637853 RepID=A0A3P7PJ90_9BILA|nr:unnamed protein product [Gongylonema pulchrum]
MRPMPEEVIGARLIPLLLSRHILLDSFAHRNLIPFVLQPAVNRSDKVGLLCEPAFRRWVIPQVIKILHVHETTVRLALLAHFHLYMRYFTESELHTVLFELSLSMQDTDDRLVSASLHAMAHLVTVIGGPAVTGKLEFILTSSNM